MASALEQLVSNYDTSSPVSFYDYYNAYNRDQHADWHETNPYGFLGRFGNFFGGYVDSAKSAYDNYLSEYEYRRNAKATSAQNQLTWAREDSQVQRLMSDYKAAGLNPYMLLNNGNLSGAVVSSQASAPSYRRSSNKKEKSSNGSSIASSAIKALAMIAIMG